MFFFTQKQWFCFISFRRAEESPIVSKFNIFTVRHLKLGGNTARIKSNFTHFYHKIDFSFIHNSSRAGAGAYEAADSLVANGTLWCPMVISVLKVIMFPKSIIQKPLSK